MPAIHHSNGRKVGESHRLESPLYCWGSSAFHKLVIDYCIFTSVALIWFNMAYWVWHLGTFLLSYFLHCKIGCLDSCGRLVITAKTWKTGLLKSLTNTLGSQDQSTASLSLSDTSAAFSFLLCLTQYAMAHRFFFHMIAILRAMHVAQNSIIIPGKKSTQTFYCYQNLYVKAHYVTCSSSMNIRHNAYQLQNHESFSVDYQRLLQSSGHKQWIRWEDPKGQHATRSLLDAASGKGMYITKSNRFNCMNSFHLEHTNSTWRRKSEKTRLHHGY